MPLRPLGKKVVGRLLQARQEEGFIIQPFSEDRPAQYAMKVTGIGAACTEVKIDDVVILPENGWVTVTLLEEGEPVEQIAIREDLLLAVVE